MHMSVCVYIWTLCGVYSLGGLRNDYINMFPDRHRVDTPSKNRCHGAEDSFPPSCDFLTKHKAETFQLWETAKLCLRSLSFHSRAYYQESMSQDQGPSEQGCLVTAASLETSSPIGIMLTWGESKVLHLKALLPLQYWDGKWVLLAHNFPDTEAKEEPNSTVNWVYIESLRG